MTAGPRAGAALLSIASALAIAGLSRVSYDATTGAVAWRGGEMEASSGALAANGSSARTLDAAGNAVIRLSWRLPSERVEECRRLGREELERLPVHMRREEVCEGRTFPYRLRVTLDDSVVVDEIVQARGAREDRPLFVFQELVVPSGAYGLEVRWERQGDGGDGDRRESGRRNTGAGSSSDLAIEAGLRLAPRDVTLITYDVDGRTLVALGGGIVSTEVSGGGNAADPREPARDADNRRSSP